MGRQAQSGIPDKADLKHTVYIDDAALEAAGVASELQDANHGHHGPQTAILSRRELDQAREEELLRISLLGPTM